jgi:hypothetical protein
VPIADSIDFFPEFTLVSHRINATSGKILDREVSVGDIEPTY